MPGGLVFEVMIPVFVPPHDGRLQSGPLGSLALLGLLLPCVVLACGMFRIRLKLKDTFDVGSPQTFDVFLRFLTDALRIPDDAALSARHSWRTLLRSSIRVVLVSFLPSL